MTLVVPYFEEGSGIAEFIHCLSSVNLPNHSLNLVIVDDASYRFPAKDFIPPGPWPFDVSVLSLASNSGHQAALAVGLQEALSDESDAYVLADSDGEDDLLAIPVLLETLETTNVDVVAATRGKRSESFAFRAAYALHRALFRVASGTTLDFGNFMVLARPAAQYVVNQPSARTHIAATVLRSNLLLERVTVDRRARFLGESKMTAASLLRHSLASLSVFLDRMFPRLLVFAGLGLGLILGLLGAVVAVRLFTDLGVPGWATYAAGILLLGAFQLLSLFALVTVLSIISAQQVAATVSQGGERLHD